ncbi:hypothetical protein OCU04_009100 [Sclerotinia nivalis]|uniref:Uncharacterized protein n=1 Tax=Sclerotinia nivalis TaxID=352851 RepID=A0A9X0AH51_9HELO|nr:hypothetical protein OCU04_009100 [Sclerotinia nivalis]
MVQKTSSQFLQAENILEQFSAERHSGQKLEKRNNKWKINGECHLRTDDSNSSNGQGGLTSTPLTTSLSSTSDSSSELELSTSTFVKIIVVVIILQVLY